MNYFEVLYANWHGEKAISLVATPNDTPETSYDFGWNGNRLIDWMPTTFDNYRHNVRKFFIDRV